MNYIAIITLAILCLRSSDIPPVEYSNRTMAFALFAKNPCDQLFRLFAGFGQFHPNEVTMKSENCSIITRDPTKLNAAIMCGLSFRFAKPTQPSPSTSPRQASALVDSNSNRHIWHLRGTTPCLPRSSHICSELAAKVHLKPRSTTACSAFKNRCNLYKWDMSPIFNPTFSCGVLKLSPMFPSAIRNPIQYAASGDNGSAKDAWSTCLQHDRPECRGVSEFRFSIRNTEVLTMPNRLAITRVDNPSRYKRMISGSSAVMRWFLLPIMAS